MYVMFRTQGVIRCRQRISPCSRAPLFATVQTSEPRINICSDCLSCGLLLNCIGENRFLDIQHKKHVYDVNYMCGVYKCKKSTFLLGMVALCTRLRTSTLAGPMLESTAPLLVPLPSPHCPFFLSTHPHMRT